MVTVAVLGLDGAGKTSFLNALQGDAGARVRPTVGFKPLSMALNEALQIKFYDIGGGKKIRGIWDKYYHDVHACIYMVDASDAARNDEAVEVFKKTMGDGGLGGKPLCIVCNKQDVEGAASPADATTLRHAVTDFSPRAGRWRRSNGASVRAPSGRRGCERASSSRRSW